MRGAGPVEANEVVTTIGVFFGAGLAAYVGYFLKAKPPEKQMQITGALVDGSSVKELAAAIAKQTDAARDSINADEKWRQVRYRLVEKIEKLTDEVEELRRGLADATNEIARRR